MAYRIRRVAAVADHVVKSRIAGDPLVLAKRRQQVAKGLRGDLEAADGVRQRHEDRMSRRTRVASIEFALPLVEQPQRGLGIAHLVSQVIGNSTIGIHIKEVLPQLMRQKPGGNREVLVVRPGQTTAILAGLSRRGRPLRNGVLRG